MRSPGPAEGPLGSGSRLRSRLFLEDSFLVGGPFFGSFLHFLNKIFFLNQRIGVMCGNSSPPTFHVRLLFAGVAELSGARRPLAGEPQPLWPSQVRPSLWKLGSVSPRGAGVRGRHRGGPSGCCGDLALLPNGGDASLGPGDGPGDEDRSGLRAAPAWGDEPRWSAGPGPSQLRRPPRVSHGDRGLSSGGRTPGLVGRPRGGAGEGRRRPVWGCARPAGPPVSSGAQCRGKAGPAHVCSSEPCRPQRGHGGSSPLAGGLEKSKDACRSFVSRRKVRLSLAASQDSQAP